MLLLQVEDTRKRLVIADILRQFGRIYALRSSCGYTERAAREREALCALQQRHLHRVHSSRNLKAGFRWLRGSSNGPPTAVETAAVLCVG